MEIEEREEKIWSACNTTNIRHPVESIAKEIGRCTEISRPVGMKSNNYPLVVMTKKWSCVAQKEHYRHGTTDADWCMVVGCLVAVVK